MGPSDAPQFCPQCGLTNTATAARCDCGWEFKNPFGLTPKRRRDIPLNAIGVASIAAAAAVVHMAIQRGVSWQLLFSQGALVCVFLVWQGVRLIRARRPLMAARGDVDDAVTRAGVGALAGGVLSWLLTLIGG